MTQKQRGDVPNLKKKLVKEPNSFLWAVTSRTTSSFFTHKQVVCEEPNVDDRHYLSLSSILVSTSQRCGDFPAAFGHFRATVIIWRKTVTSAPDSQDVPGNWTKCETHVVLTTTQPKIQHLQHEPRPGFKHPSGICPQRHKRFYSCRLFKGFHRLRCLFWDKFESSKFRTKPSNVTHVPPQKWYFWWEPWWVLVGYLPWFLCVGRTTS